MEFLWPLGGLVFAVVAFLWWWGVGKQAPSGDWSKTPKVKKSSATATAVATKATAQARKKPAKTPTQQLRKGRAVGGNAAEKLAVGTVQQHRLLAEPLRGPGGSATCVAVDATGAQIAVAYTDSSIRVTTVDFSNADHPFPSPVSSVRTLLEGRDVATAMDFSSDGLSLFVALEYRANLTRLKIGPDDKGKHLQPIFKSDEIMHKDQVRMLVASKGNWILTVGPETETEMKIWSYSGELLTACDTKQIRNYQINVSPLDGRFFGAAAWTSGIKLWEILNLKQGAFSKVERAMDLKTTCGTVALALSPNNKQAVLATKDCMVMTWNIDVRYKVSEDSKRLCSVHETDERFQHISGLAYSADGKKIALSSERNVKIYDAADLRTLDVIHGAQGSHIDRIVVPSVGNFFITTAAEERPRLWRFS